MEYLSTNVVDAESERESWRPYLLLGLAVLAVGLAAWRPMPAGVWHDDGVYVMVGKALAEGHGMTYQGVVGAPPAVKFPPVYPSMLAGLWLVLGSIGAVTLAATLANLVFLALAAIFIARALRTGAGAALWIALLAGGLAVTSGDVLRISSAALSEALFLALAAGAFTLWPGATRGDRTGSYRVALAALLLVLIGTRAAGLAFVVGFGLAMALGRAGPRAAALVAGPALATWLGWSAWADRRAATIPVDMQDLLGPYGGWMSEQFFSDPGGFIARFPAHAMGVFERMAILLLPRVDGLPLWLAAVPLFAVATYGWLDARQRIPPLAWSTLAYLGLLLVWPYLDRRLVVPLHVFVVALLAIGTGALVQGLRARRAVLAVTVVMGSWAGFYAIVNAHRIAVEWPTAAYRIRADRLAAGVEAMRRTVPSDAIVGAPEFWAALHLHGGWTVAPSVLFDPASTDAEAPVWGSPEAQERLWRSAGVEYLLLEQGGLLHGATLDLLEERCPGMVRVLARTPPMLVVRLVWDHAEDGTPCITSALPDP
jgi:hypothetical protein